MRTSALLFHSEGTIPTDRFAQLLKMIDIPGATLTDIDSALQARFFQKKPGTNEPLERWELEKVTLACPEHEIRGALAHVGFINRVTPTKDRYKRGGWPGALLTRAAVRLSDLIEAWENGIRWDETVIFAGERPLQAEKETYEEACKAIGIAPGGLSQEEWMVMKKTEGEMMRWMMAWSDLPEDFAELETIFINAPMKPNPSGGADIRPNSEDPVHLWLKDEPQPGSMLFSSGAPYCMAQNEAMWMILGPLGHAIETFGHAVPPSLGLEALLREVAGCVNRIRRARCTP